MEEGIKTSQRVSRSCIECGRRKIKCDKNIPCRACVRRNLAHECQRPITRVRGQLTVAGSSDHVSETEHCTIDELLRERGALQAQIARLETILALSQPCAYRPEQEPSSDATLQDLVPALEQFDLGVGSTSDGAVVSEKGIADRLYQPAVDPLFVLLPSKDASDILITYSLTTLGWLHCAVNATTFLAEHDEFWKQIQLDVALDRESRPWFAVYLALLATALLYLDPEELPARSDLPQLSLIHQDSDDSQIAVHIARIWYEAALKEIERCSCSGVPSLQVVQALSILTLCHSNFGEHQREWLFAGTAANVARCLDMHQLSSELAHPQSIALRPMWATPEQREMGRRLWWTIVIRDWLGSWSRPPSISPASFSCQFATDNHLNHNIVLDTNRDGKTPSPLLYQSIISQIAYILYINIKVTTRRTAASYAKALEEIESVKRNLPLHLSSRFPSSIDDEEWESEHGWVPFQRYVVTHALDFMQLSIARTLAMGKIGPEPNLYRTIALESATRILQRYLDPVPRVYQLVWVVSAATAAAAIFLSLDIFMNPREYSAARRQELVVLLSQVASELSEYSAVAIHASKGSSFIQVLVAQLHQEEDSMLHLSATDILNRLSSQETQSNSQRADVGNLAFQSKWDEIWSGDDSIFPITNHDLWDPDNLGPSETWDAILDISTQ